VRSKALDVAIDVHARFYRAVDTGIVIVLIALPVMAVRKIWKVSR
jgi:hypothetical protein